MKIIIKLRRFDPCAHGGLFGNVNSTRSYMFRVKKEKHGCNNMYSWILTCCSSIVLQTRVYSGSKFTSDRERDVWIIDLFVIHRLNNCRKALCFRNGNIIIKWENEINEVSHHPEKYILLIHCVYRTKANTSARWLLVRLSFKYQPLFCVQIKFIIK